MVIQVAAMIHHIAVIQHTSVGAPRGLGE
jgi:hypothetical protein